MIARGPLAAPVRMLAALVLAVAAAAQQDLGLGRMWTFHAPPLDHLRREYDFAPDPKWFDAVRLASLRFGRDCSASFVSPHGLILTNHHCVRRAIAAAQGAQDWVSSGFVAADWSAEVPLAGIEVEQLVTMTDVTARVERGVGPDDPPATAAAARQRNIDAVLAAARAEAPQLRSQVEALFYGAEHWLYQYRVFDDVRLVMAPHLQIAHFGGDTDNFTYPRYGIDFAFCRAWVDGAPADTADTSFGWSDGPVPEQFVVLVGNPGRTQRHLTTPQLEFLRDVRYPRVRELIDHRLDLLRQEAARDPASAKRLRTGVLAYENGQKLYRGEHRALQDAALLARKDAAEAALRRRIDAAPELAARYGHLFDDLAAVAAERRALEGRTAFHNAGGLPALRRALALVAFAAGGGDDALQAARGAGDDDRELRRRFFCDHLERARRWLPADDPYLAAMLAGATPAVAAARLEDSALVADAQFLELAAAGAAAIAASGDPAVVLARTLRPMVDAARAADRALDEREAALRRRFGGLLYAVHGRAVAADATFSLRFADGRVRGYDYNGTRAPWRTVFLGMFARSAEFDGAHPFDLPAPWQQARDRLDLAAGVDFVCTCDATGGNSGSPVIDAERRVVGLLFDGNIESLANEFFFADTVQRSVCVHPQAITAALTEVYDAAHIVRELRRQQR